MSRLSRSLPPLYAVGAVRLLMPLGVLPWMAARLGPEAFGRLSFILVWSGLLGMLVEGGFLAAATRLAVNADAPQRRRLAQQVFTARCALCVPTVVLAFAAVHWATQWAGPSAGQEIGHLAGQVTGPGGAGPAAPGLGPLDVGDAMWIAALACAVGWPATWYLQATQQLGRWARVELGVYLPLLLLTGAFADSVGAYLGLQLAASLALAVLGWRQVGLELRGDAGGQRAASPLRFWSADALRPGLRLGWTMLPVGIAGAAYSFGLPAAASSRLPGAELGVYFIADRVVRALVFAADPVFSVVYPRIVERFAGGARAALRYAARWALAGAAGGALLLLLLLVGFDLAWPIAAPRLAHRGAGFDAAALRSLLEVLGWLLPLLLGWKFIGYWLLGSRRFDAAYRTAIVVGGIVGTASALSIGGAAGAAGLAWTSLGVELLVIVLSLAGGALTLRRR